eukprot:2577972-Prymnesium_polylepis.1
MASHCPYSSGGQTKRPLAGRHGGADSDCPTRQRNRSVRSRPQTAPSLSACRVARFHRPVCASAPRPGREARVRPQRLHHTQSYRMPHPARVGGTRHTRLACWHCHRDPVPTSSSVSYTHLTLPTICSV